jgi:hypothetical protein
MDGLQILPSVVGKIPATAAVAELALGSLGSVMPLRIMTLSITPLCIMTLRIKGLIVRLSLAAFTIKCHYAECSILFIVMLNVITLNGVG